MTAPKWHVLWTGETYNPLVVEQARVASGAYAIRDRRTHEVFYVGESSRGTIWKTMLRHFQAPASFAAQRETGVFTGDPRKYEVAIHITSRGHRPRPPAHGSAPSKRLRTLKSKGTPHRTDADQRAMASQARWIARLKPTKNKDDGMAAADELRAHRAKQEREDRDAGAFGSVLNPSTLVQRGRSPRTFASRKKAIAAGKRLVRRTGRPADVVTTPGRGRERTIAANPAPVGELVELGKLTELVPSRGKTLRWSLREAPALGFDTEGRLFIVYTGKIVRASTPAELRAYARTHWGVRAKGHTRAGGVAVGPFIRIGSAKSITYTTRKGFDGELVDYVHPFGEGASAKGFIAPWIVEHQCVGGCGPRCAARGALSLEGGSYRVTPRGIVG